MALPFIGLLLLGLWNLFCPRESMRSRRGGDPSPEHVFTVRAGGVILIVIAVAVPLALWGSEREEARRARLEEAWGITFPTYSGEELRTELWEGLPVDGSLTSPDLRADERQVPAVRYAVVGEDDAVIPDDARPTGAKPSDLVVMMAEAPVCEPSRLVVEELPDQVRLTVVTVPGPEFAQARKEAYESQKRRDAMYSRSSQADGTPSDEIEREDEESTYVYPGCDTLDLPLLSSGNLVWRLVHVPLDRPLRERTLVDTTSGDDVPRVTTPDG